MNRAVIRCRHCESEYLGVRGESGDVVPIAGGVCADCGSAEFTALDPEEL